MKENSPLYVFLKEEGIDLHYEGGLYYPSDGYVRYELLNKYVQWLADNRYI